MAIPSIPVELEELEPIAELEESLANQSDGLSTTS